jgi:hypothetical protein
MLINFMRDVPLITVLAMISPERTAVMSAVIGHRYRPALIVAILAVALFNRNGNEKAIVV